MFKIVSLAALALAQFPITNCGELSDPFKIESVNFEPYPIVIGQPVFVTAIGSYDSTKQVSTGSTTNIVLKLGTVPVFKEVTDFCEGSAQGGKECPLTNGPQTIRVKQNVPPAAPAGNFNLEVTVADQDGTRVTCFASKVRLVKQ
jgi:hypothetical protein